MIDIETTIKLKLLCSECNEELKIKRNNSPIKNIDRVMVKPCSNCNKRDHTDLNRDNVGLLKEIKEILRDVETY